MLRHEPEHRRSDEEDHEGNLRQRRDVDRRGPVRALRRRRHTEFVSLTAGPDEEAIDPCDTAPLPEERLADKQRIGLLERTLRALPVDVLKIDRAFAQTTDGRTDAVLLEAIVRLGHSLGIEMIAEGIELEEQAAALRRLGCRQAQGYLFHRPLAAKDSPCLP